MKTVSHKLLLIIFLSVTVLITSCRVFQGGSGCPANGKAVGAERILSGEKVPKAKKFRS